MRWCRAACLKACDIAILRRVAKNLMSAGKPVADQTATRQPEGETMALRDPVAVYNAANNIEAHLICDLLNDAGIEAHVTEDVSVVGQGPLGFLPEVHKPQVWTERVDIERVKPFLEEYERQQLQRREAEMKRAAAGEATVEATCEECGQRSAFPAAQDGTVQDCPHCGAYVDVGDIPDTEEWWGEPESGDDAKEKQ